MDFIFIWMWLFLNTLRPGQDGCQFPDDIFKYILLNENIRISIEISLKFVPKAPINNIPALVQIMAWRRPGDKPLSEPMMISLLTHICITRPQWVKNIESIDQLICMDDILFSKADWCHIYNQHMRWFKILSAENLICGNVNFLVFTRGIKGCQTDSN